MIFPRFVCNDEVLFEDTFSQKNKTSEKVIAKIN